MEHRMGERIHVDSSIILHVPDRGALDATLEDISFTGAGIRLNEPVSLDIYTSVEVWLKVSETFEPGWVRVDGFVVRVRDGLVGIMFMQELMWMRQLRQNLSSQNYVYAGQQSSA